MRSLLLATTVLASAAIAATAVPATAFADAPPTSAAVTDPATMLPARPGSDYFLANYTQVTAWLKKIAGESDRMKLVSIGKTAEGREQYMAIISSPENIRNLEHYRQIAKQLALAKGLTDAQAHALASEGKAMVWIDAGLHATEVTNAQAHIEIIHEMLTKNDPETLRLLGDDVMLFVFANPDGLELVANWYMQQPACAFDGIDPGPLPEVHRPRRQPRQLRLEPARDDEHEQGGLSRLVPADPVQPASDRAARARWSSSRRSATRTTSTTSRW